MENPKKSVRPGWGAHGAIKDASSTDVVVHAGHVLSTYYQCGEGYRLDPYTLEDQGTSGWVPLDGISAHPKVDERTGELLFFNYSSTRRTCTTASSTETTSSSPTCRSRCRGRGCLTTWSSPSTTRF
jgi:carotenoid cleavage dioxygenase-like enzyme